jgi:hypothetical protein
MCLPSIKHSLYVLICFLVFLNFSIALYLYSLNILHLGTVCLHEFNFEPCYLRFLKAVYQPA